MIYLAGPFFNEIQRNFAEDLAKHARNRGHQVFAPVDLVYEEGGTISPTDIFERNTRWIKESKIMFAQLDYPVPFGQELKNPLPDSGTIWEMGYATAKGIPVYGYCRYEKVSKINLMLAQCCSGFFDNIFNVFGKNGKLNLELAQIWKGSQT